MGPWSLRGNPAGEQVVGGAASFNRPDSATLIVNQQSDRAIIHWDSFSIANGELTRFVQPSSTSAALNRVVTANPSQIYGTLQANGILYLINPGGVMVGPGGVVDVAGFVASTHEVGNEEFMRAGHLNFHGHSEAGILNQGNVTAREGDVFLVAREVKNEGQLMAQDGTVGMVSGTEVSLQAVGQGNFKIRLLAAEKAEENSEFGTRNSEKDAEIVNEGVIQAANAVLEAKGSYLPMAIKNTGLIEATGIVHNPDGTVTLTGGEGDILNTGVVAALQKSLDGQKQVGGSIVMTGKNVTSDLGSILTAAGEGGGGLVKLRSADTTVLRGSIEVVGTGVSAKGGQVQLLGDKVGMFESAKVDASGGAGGGEVLVGGDYLGKNPDVPNAKAVVMAPTAEIRADATAKGDGGKVILWSDEYTGFFGEISARGGVRGGNGGFVETSSKDNLQAFGRVDASAPSGRTGLWLLDPRDVVITNGIPATTNGTFTVANPTVFDPTNDTALILNSQINDALDRGTSVTITTGTNGTQAGNITVNAPILRSKPGTNEAGQVTLTMLAASNIVVNSNITSTSGSLALAFYADADANNTGSFTLNASLTTLGGDVLISAAGLNYTSGTITTATALNGGTNQTIAGDITLRPSAPGRTIGVNAVGSDFVVPQTLLTNMTVAGTALPGTVIIGSRAAGTMTIGADTIFSDNGENLKLVTGGNLLGPAGTNAVTLGNGILILSAAGSISDTAGTGSFLFTGSRVAAILEGNALRLSSFSTLEQISVTTDGTVSTQNVRDNQGGTPNLNWSVGETTNSSGGGGNTTISGISVRTNSVAISYENTLGDIAVTGGGISSLLIRTNVAATITNGTPFTIPGSSTGNNASGFFTNSGTAIITNPGTGYSGAPSTITVGTNTLTLGTSSMATNSAGMAGIGTLNVQPANNGASTNAPSDFVLSAPSGVVVTTVPLFTGGGNFTLRAQDVALPGIFSGSFLLTDEAGQELPSVRYANVGVLNTFRATNNAIFDPNFIGGTFGFRRPLLPNEGAPGQVFGVGGVLTLEAVSTSAEGQPVSIGGGTGFTLNIFELPLLEAPGIRIGGPQTGDISINSILVSAGNIENQSITTRPTGSGSPNNQNFDYDPRYFENPFFDATRLGSAPINVNENASSPHVAGGTVSFVSGRGYVRNVQGGDVHVNALSLTAVDDIFFDARSTGGSYAQLGTTQASGSEIGAISARSGRTLPQENVTIGNGGDIELNLNFTTRYVNDSRLPISPTATSFSVSQVATATATIAGGSLEMIDTAAGGMLYASAPVVTITGGGVQEASARAILSGDGVALVVPQIVGGGYTPSATNSSGVLLGPSVTLSGGGSSAQSATIGNNGMAFVSDNGILSVFSVTNGGSGYNPSAPPQVIITGGGSGTSNAPTRPAVARAVVNQSGVVTGLIVVDPGEGYTANPSGISIIIQAPTGGGVRAEAVVDADFQPALFGNRLTPIYVSSAGSGYTVEPTVTITGGGIKQAEARAVVQLDPFSNRYGQVVGFEITDSGLGYTGAPTVTLGSGQAFGNFGEYGISTETVDRNVGSGNISLSNVPYNVVGTDFILNAPIRTGDALGVPGGNAISGSILLNVSGYISANDNNSATAVAPNPGGARGMILTGDAGLIPEFSSLGNARSGSVTILGQGIKNGTTAASTLYTLSGSEGFPIQIGTATGGLSNVTGSLNVSLLARLPGTPEVGDLQIYAPAPGQVQAALGNVPLDPNHAQGKPRSSNDLFLSGLSTPEFTTDAGGNVIEDESLVSVEVGAFEGKLTLLRRAESQATAVVVNNRVTLILPEQGGALFATAPTVVITGGGVTPASASVFVSNGTLVAPNGGSQLTVGNGIDEAGAGYFTVPTVSFTGGGGSGAEAVAIIDGTGRLTGIQITNPGFGYTSLPTVVISSPTGVQAVATATVEDQTLAETTLTVANGGITNPGVGYGSNPLVVVTGGRTGQATAQATVDSDPNSPTYSQITAITIALNGDSFPSGTADVFIGPPAGAAQATANVQNGVVTSFTITDAGGGYSSTPRVLLSTGTGTTPYTLAGDRVGLIADRLSIFDSTTPANVLFEAGLVALAPYTNQRPVSLGANTPGATSLLLADLQRFLADELVVGRRNAAYQGVGAGEITIQAALASDNLRVSNGLFLAGTRGLSDRGGTTGISFPAVSINVGSTVSLTGTGNALRYFSGIIQGPFDELTYRKSMTLSSGLRSSTSGVQQPLTISEIFGNPAYFTGQRFNQGLTTQNGDVTIKADLLEQTRLVGFIDTTGGGKYPVSSAPNSSVDSLSDYATVILAPQATNRAVSIYATTPGSGLALRVGNPQALGLEQIKAGTLQIGDATTGAIILNSDLGFNYLQYPNAPRALTLWSGTATVTAATSQVPPSPNPVATPSAIRVANLTIRSKGSVSLTGSNQVSILNAPDVQGNLTFLNRSGVAISLGQVNVSGNLALTNNGAITQTTVGVTVGGTANFSAGSNAITLNLSTNNNFGEAVSLANLGTNNKVEISDKNALILGTNSVGGDLDTSSGGDLNLGSGNVGGGLAANAGTNAITQSGGLTIGGTSSITAGSMTLTNNNTFTGAIDLIGTSTNTLSLSNAGSLTIRRLTNGGSVGISAGTNLTFATDQNYNSLTNGITATAGGTLTLSNSMTNLTAASSFLAGGALTLADPVQISVAGANTLTLQGATINLGTNVTAVTANGGITLLPAGATSTNTIAINNAGGPFAITDAQLLQLSSTGTVTVGSTNQVNSFNIGSLGAVDLSGEGYSLNLASASGNVTFSSTLILPNNTKFDLSVGSGDVNAGGIPGSGIAVSIGGTGTISFGSAGNVNSFTGSASDLGTSNVTGNLNYISVSPGNLSVGQMSVGGTSTFLLPVGGSFTAFNPANAFTGSVTLAGAAGSALGDVAINNSKPLTLSSLNIGGNFTASGVGINGGSVAVGGNTTLTGGAGDVTLTDSGNSFVGSLSVVSSLNTSLFVSGNQLDNLGAVQATQNFALTTDAGTLTLPTAVAANNQLSTDQIQNFTVGSLALTAGSVAVNNAFNFPNIQALSLRSTNGAITAPAVVTAANLSLNSATSATLGAGNRIANLGSIQTGSGDFTLVNLQGMNLAGSVSVAGAADLTVAGQFYNYSGQATPFAGTTGRAVVRSLSMMGGMPNQISALAGFTPSYNFTDPGTSRAMIYAVSPLTMFAPGGTVIAGIDLSGTQTGGGQLNTFFTGSDNLNWMIADFGKFNLPKVEPARLEYMLYPQRVEPETRSLPQPVLRELTQELGRPPTLGEIQQREVARREASRMRAGAILERTSFDEDAPEPRQEAKGSVPEIDGGKPQADAGGERKVDRGPWLDVGVSLPESGKPQAKRQTDTKRDPNGPILPSGPRKVVVELRPASVSGTVAESSPDQILREEREKAEVHVAPPVAGMR